ncbi:hypothetical protein H4582DRAFT_2095424 [Lactarius indigo]|nr:hypothetical protein H4582DRAFT_2095424 [Lactarius indigo]
MPKRTFAQIESSSPDLPLKRIHTSTPASASSAVSTPYTPSVYSTPADSPTNPLGLKRRVNNLTLPKASPFSKHIALRFQLITPAPESAPPPKPSLWNTPPDSSPATDEFYSKNPAAEKYAREGTYRIVQAPAFVLLPPLACRHLYSCSPATPSAPPRAPGHLFSGARQTLALLGTLTTPRAPSRISSPLRMHRGRVRRTWRTKKEDASWRWEGEDDLTLGHVVGCTIRATQSTGIIYYHDEKTSVHITLNTQTVPHRKGVGNMPFVFRAYGTAHLDPTRSVSGGLLDASTRNRIDSSPAHLPDLQAPRVPSAPQRPRPTTLTDGLDTRVWNRTWRVPALPLARPRLRTHFLFFLLFLSLALTIPIAHLPTITFLASPLLVSVANDAASSAASLSLPAGSASWASMASSSPVRSLPSLTPAPARPRTRYRVARAARRLLGLTERGLESEAAEEADVVEGRVQGQSKMGRKADARKKDRARRRATRSATTEEVWNPFAHLKDI